VRENPRPDATADEVKKVDRVYQIYNQCALYRANFASHWEEVAQLIYPNQKNTFYRESYNAPGVKKTALQVDASGMVALGKFGAICESMITPFSSKWHNLEATDPKINKNRQVRLYLEQVSKILFDARYMAKANFRKQNQQLFQSVGAFGNGGMFIDQLYDMHNRPVQGFRYKCLPLGETYIRVNHQGQVDAFVRPYKATARQAVQQFGLDMLPDDLFESYEKDSETLYDFFHCVYPNDDYDAREKLTVNGKPFISHYVSCSGRRLMQEGGYYSFPMPFARYTQAPNEVYGRGPAMDVLPALKTLNAEKATFLKAGHRAADPVLLLADDGISDFSLVPGAMNKGGVNSDGRPLVHTLEPGNIQISKEMMDEERVLIGDVFLTTIFQTLVENPNMTATQVIELINQKGIFLAPTVGGMASDYLDPMIERELELGSRLGMFPEMPGLLREAKGEYKIVYTSPLFKAARAGEASGFLRTVETALQIAGQTGDPSILDPFDFDTALPDIANIQDVPESWMRSKESIAVIRQTRGQAMQRQQEIQALPAQAAMVKAQAVVKKAGGTLPEQVNA
jgi:hypothetical protein